MTSTKTTTSDFPVAYWGDRKIVWVDSSRIEESLAFYRQQKLDGVGINAMHGFTLDNVDFLREHDHVGGVVVVSSTKPMDLSAIAGLRQLRFLSVSDNKQPLDLDAFPLLEDFRGDWHKKVHFTEASASLRSLHLWKYKPKSRDLSELPALVGLKELGLTQAAVESLAGVERLKAITTMDIAYARGLTDISTLAGLPKLDCLVVENCPKLSCPDVLTTLKGLRVLRLNSCGPLPSLSFLDSLPLLEEFRFVNTNVLDGDLTPVLRLKRVGFLNKRHFSHTHEQVESALKQHRT